MHSDDSPENELRRREEDSRRRAEPSAKGSGPPPLPPEDRESGAWGDIYHAPRSVTAPPPPGPEDAWRTMMRRRRKWMWWSFVPIFGFPIFAQNGALGVFVTFGWLMYCAAQIVKADFRPSAFPLAFRVFGWVIILFILNLAVVLVLFFAACGVIALYYQK